MIQEYLRFSELDALASSPEGVRAAFSRKFGADPDGIALNDTTYFNATQPPLTQQFQHFCYKTVTDHQFGPSTDESSRVAIVGSNTAKNNGDTPSDINLPVTGDWRETLEWSSVVQESGLTFSKLPLDGTFRMGMGFSVTIAPGKDDRSSTPKSSSTNVTVTVPPRSQVTVNMVATMKSETMPFLAPITVSGMFGANFPERVRGHCYWFSDVGDLVGRTRGQILGRITGTAAFDVHTDIQPAVPIG